MTMLEKAIAQANAVLNGQLGEGHNVKVDEVVRAVLAAIREPDEAMLDAVGCGGVFQTGIAGLAWSQSFGAMIDAILAGREK
jgi:hypothetical protein